MPEYTPIYRDVESFDFGFCRIENVRNTADICVYVKDSQDCLLAISYLNRANSADFEHDQNEFFCFLRLENVTLEISEVDSRINISDSDTNIVSTLFFPED